MRAIEIQRPAYDLRRLARHQRIWLRALALLVLLALTLAFAVYHIHNLLKEPLLTTTSTTLAAFNHGPLEMSYSLKGGAGQPTLFYYDHTVLTYAPWSSTITVNGVTQPLWNSYQTSHISNVKDTVTSVASGAGWQVFQSVTLVNDSTMTVSYAVATHPQAGEPAPSHIELAITHLNDVWYAPTTRGATFQAQIVGANASALRQLLQQGAVPQAIGAVNMTLSGSAIASNPYSLTNAQQVVAADGSTHAWASQLTTRYTLDAPPANQIIPLGVETITFQPSPVTDGSTPVGGPVTSGSQLPGAGGAR